MEQRWSGVDQNTSDGIKMRSNGIKMQTKVDQKCGAKWIKNVDQNAVQGGAKDMCFYLIPNWSLALRQAHLNTGITEILEKGLY